MKLSEERKEMIRIFFADFMQLLPLILDAIYIPTLVEIYLKFPETLKWIFFIPFFFGPIVLHNECKKFVMSTRNLYIELYDLPIQKS